VCSLPPVLPNKDCAREANDTKLSPRDSEVQSPKLCSVISTDGPLLPSGPAKLAPTLDPMVPCQVEVRHPKSLNGLFMSLPAFYDTGAAGEFIHPDIVKSILRAGVITSNDIHGFSPPLRYCSITGQSLSSHLMVSLDILTPENRSAVIVFQITDHIPSDMLFIGNKGLKQLGFLFDCDVARRPDSPRPPKYSVCSFAAALFEDSLRDVASIPVPGLHSEFSPTLDPIDELPEPVASLSLSAATAASVPLPITPAADMGIPLAAVVLPPDSLVIEHSTATPGRVKLEVRCPAIEKATPDPVRNPRRRCGNNANLVKSIKLRQLEQLGQVEQVSIALCHFIENTVVVDKRPDLPRPFGGQIQHEVIQARYRITLDAKRANALIFVIGPDGVIKAAIPTLAHAVRSGDLHQAQYQASGFESILMMPQQAQQWFAKVDIRDSFQSLVLPIDMRRFFATQVYCPETGKQLCYRWTTWPQGFRYSTMAFRNAATYILEKFTSLEHIAPVVDALKLAFANMTDDIIIAAATQAQCAATLAELIKFLEAHSLFINPNKTVHPCQKLVYCGYDITPDGIKPSPTRREITSAFADEAYTRLTSSLSDREQTLTIFRSMAGSFQFYNRGFLAGDQQLLLRTFYDLSTQLLRDPTYELTSDDLSQIKSALDALTDWVVNGCPHLRMGSLGARAIASLLVVDSNAPAWSGICFKVASLPSPACPDDLCFNPLLQPMISVLASQPGVVLPPHFTVYPCYIDGGVWSSNIDKGRSSTGRERVGQLRFLAQVEPHLEGLIYFICDNGNTRWDVIDPSVEFGGAMMPYYLRYQELVDGTIWLPRTSIPSWADFLARVLERRQIVETPSVHAAFPAGNQMVLPIPDFPDLSLRAAIIHGYATDQTTTFNSIYIHDIYTYLIHQAPAPTGFTRKIATRFVLGANGLLYYLSRDLPRVVVPHCICSSILPSLSPLPVRNALLWSTHQANGPHVGSRRMLDILTVSWYWPHMETDVQRFTKSCHICVRYKATFFNVGTLSSVALQATQIFQLWVVDYAGPFTLADNTKRWVILFLDSKSRWLVTSIVDSMTGETFKNSLEANIIDHFGFPETDRLTLHCDKGSNMTAFEIRTYAALHNIRLNYGFTSHPRGQGFVEISVKELKTSLSTALAECRGHLPLAEAVRKATQTHNLSKHSATRVSPYEYVYNRRYVHRVNNLLPQDDAPEESNFRAIHDARFAEEVEKASQKYEDTRSTRATVTSPGQLVWRYYKQNHSTNILTGPHTVLRRHGSNSWVIASTGTYPQVHELEVPEIQLHVVAMAEDLREGLPLQN